MTETTALVTLNHPFHTARGSIGKPLAGREVRVAEDGEILVRGESIANTEWRAGHAQARTADEGWLRTGDLAARNDKGELVFAGRKSDVIVTAAGLNVHPQDLEAALSRQPGVRDACAFAFDSGAGPQPAAALLMSDASQADAAVTSANANTRRLSADTPLAALARSGFPAHLHRQGEAPRGRCPRERWPCARRARSAAGDDPLLQALGAMPGARVDNRLRRRAASAKTSASTAWAWSSCRARSSSASQLRFPKTHWQQVRTVGDLRGFIALSAESLQDAV